MLILPSPLSLVDVANGHTHALVGRVVVVHDGLSFSSDTICHAGVAELVDACASKAHGEIPVGVRFSPPAPEKLFLFFNPSHAEK